VNGRKNAIYTRGFLLLLTDFYNQGEIFRLRAHATELSTMFCILQIAQSKPSFSFKFRTKNACIKLMNKVTKSHKDALLFYGYNSN
jgi:hypothetical protein